MLLEKKKKNFMGKGQAKSMRIIKESSHRLGKKRNTVLSLTRENSNNLLNDS